MRKPTAKPESDRDTEDRDTENAAAALYFGEVMHARLKPMGHRFSYRVMSLLIDLDRLEEANRQCLLFGVNRAALYSFNEADHGERDGSPLRAYAQRCADEHGIDLAGGRVLLLCYPRLLGYTFNPLSVYFCYRADGTLAVMIYEVRNTFGDIHAYVLPVKPGQISIAGIRQHHDKRFYVSPFIDMTMRYHFRVSPPADTRQVANSGDRPRRPPARRDLQRPPQRLDHASAAVVGFLASARHLENHGGDPLGSLEALAQGGASGASTQCRNCERRHQYRLGDRPTS